MPLLPLRYLLFTAIFYRFVNPQEATWEDVNSKLKSVCPNILSLVDLVLTIPASSADAERGFSRLKYTKTDSRSRVSDIHLTDQLCIMLESCDIKDFDPTPAIDLWNSTPRRTRSVLDIKETFVTPSTTAITPGCSSTDTVLSLDEEPVVVLDDDIQDLSCKHDTNNNIKAVVPVSVTIDLNIGSSKAVVSVANTGSGEGNVANTGSGEGNVADTGSGEGNVADTGSGEGNVANTRSGEGNVADTGSGEGNVADTVSGEGNVVDTGSGEGNVADTGSGEGNVADTGSGEGNVSASTASYIGTGSDGAVVPVSLSTASCLSTRSSNDIGVDTTDLFQEHETNITKHTLGTKDIGVNTEASLTAETQSEEYESDEDYELEDEVDADLCPKTCYGERLKLADNAYSEFCSFLDFKCRV